MPEPLSFYRALADLLVGAEWTADVWKDGLDVTTPAGEHWFLTAEPER